MERKIAIILAAGKGERLDISDKPKALVPVGHKPLILWNVEHLQDAGFDHIVIVVGHKGAAIRRELTGHPSLRHEPIFVDVGEAAGDMLQSVQAAMEELDRRGIRGTTVVTMSDLLLEKNPYLDLFTPPDSDTRARMVVGTAPEYVHASGAHGMVEIQDGLATAIGRHISPAHGGDVGVYIFPEAMHSRLMDSGATFGSLLSSLSSDRQLRAVPYVHVWFDVNTPETCIRAELFARKTYFRTTQQAIQKPLVTLERDTAFTKKKTTVTQVYIKQGLLDQLDSVAVIPEENARSPHFLIVDRNLTETIGAKVQQKFQQAGYDVHLIPMDAGEHAKTLENYGRLAEQILGEGIDERSIIFSIGGGVIANVAGFLAATLYRGIGLIHIPTTLMGQVDVAIGIKQAVNGEKGKNLIGAYYEPIAVLIDPSVLQTLPLRLIRDGLAESLKHALVQDAEFVKFFQDYRGDIRDLNFLETVIMWTAKLKIALMEKDYKEDREAMVLQYGHEVGHAVEYLSGYTKYHGESIIYGMRVSAELAALLKLCGSDVPQIHLDLFRQYGFETEIPESITTEAIMDVLRFTKKARHGDLRLALPSKIGALWTADGEYAIPCPPEMVQRAIERCRVSNGTA